MPLERHEVEKIAHLARLTLNEAQIPYYASNLSNILKLVDHINEVDTQGIEPMSHSLATLSQRLREDVVTETDQRELFQSIAPATEAGLYLVPIVIDSE